MVRLDKIYTKGGDTGETSLSNGARVPKYDSRVAAYGAVDEANAAIGVARLHTSSSDVPVDADEMLDRIQNDLFDVGADLARPHQPETQKPVLRITAHQVARLESEIDRLNADLSPLTSFVLPGGSPPSAYLHVARTIVRHAERLVCELGAKETINNQVVMYLNRLSDHLFVLARALNDQGKSDVLWQPGEHR